MHACSVQQLRLQQLKLLGRSLRQRMQRSGTSPPRSGASALCHMRCPLPTRGPCAQAEQFQKKGRSLRNKMWWQNCRMKLIVLFAVLMLGLVIFLLVCFTGKNCLKK